jgi:ATP-dependent RNA helicase RhlE
LTCTSFAELKLAEPLQRALRAENYTTPTPIQVQSIPHLLAGRDLLGCAQTGTGKTAAFALPILQQFDARRRPAASRAPRALVLSPTRELAVQIGERFAAYGRHVRFRQAMVFGGVGQAPQVRALARGVHLLVATPGRLLDLMNQGHVCLSELEVFVLDEVDRMLDMGFLPDLKRIMAQLPKTRQSLFFSATMPNHIASLASQLLSDPVRVTVTPPSSTVERTVQSVMFVAKSDKLGLLCHLLREGDARVLVFARTKHGADKVARQLAKAGLSAEAIHGNKSQPARQKTLNRFRSGSLRVLVATDIVARGIDVEGISHVINFDLPHEAESYVHRIGRTGRAGAEGRAISFCDPSERAALHGIQKVIRHTISVDDDHPFHHSAPMTVAAQPSAARHGPGGRPAHIRKRPVRSRRRINRRGQRSSRL